MTKEKGRGAGSLIGDEATGETSLPGARPLAPENPQVEESPLTSERPSVEQATASSGITAVEQAGPPLKTTVAGFLIRQLAAWGVERIYGVIGDANLYVLDELARQNRIRYIACRHECAAALMASAEAKLTGRVGVCLATSGPGVANLLNGLADAAADGAPVLAITGQVETTKIGTHAKQYVDQQRLVEPLAVWTEQAVHPDALPELLHRALAAAAAGGAVAHLSIPKDLYAKQLRAAPAPYPAYWHRPPLASDRDIDALADRLQRAKKPAFLLGRGALGLKRELRELAEACSAAVVTTLPARAAFPNDHPLYAGGLGQAGSEAATVLLRESDLIVVFGATWWPDEFTPDSAPVVQIDRVPAQIGAGYPVLDGIAGDLRNVVPRLADALRRAAAPDRSLWDRRVRTVCRSWGERIAEEAGKEGTPIPPQRVVKTISDLVADDAVIALDTGDHTLWFNRVFQAKRHDILVSGRWRTIGFGLPAAIAAKLAQPERQAVAVVGDGGAVQTIMELTTAAEQQLPVVVVVMNNGCYALEKHRMEAEGLNTLGSAVRPPDFAALAQACGANGIAADTPKRLEAALRQALYERTRPTLIDVRTAPSVVPHTKL
jgi:pyruvate dehydrogenase (quinone)/pyruvate oxidase